MNTLIEAIEMIEAPLRDAIDEAFGFNDGALEQLAIAQRAVHLALGLALAEAEK